MMVVTVSQKWIDNQLEAASSPNIANGYLETIAPNTVTDWVLDNTDAENLTTIDITREFDYSCASIPFSSSAIVIDNGMYAYERNPYYDFTIPSVKAKGDESGLVNFNIGYKYDDGTTESIPWFSHVLDNIVVDDYDSSVTINTNSSVSALDSSIYCFGTNNITAREEVISILEKQPLGVKGYYNYVIGNENCVVSDTMPIFTSYSLANYVVGDELAAYTIDVPIPLCTYREALTMVCAYVGAYVFEQRDGSLLITKNLPEPRNYVFDESTVYDRPKRIAGQKIKDCSVTINSYTDTGVNEGAEVITIEGDLLLDVAGRPQEFTVTHDAISEHIMISAWMKDDVDKVDIIDPSYTITETTYAAKFRVIPTGDSRGISYSITVTKPITSSRTYTKTYKSMGDSITLTCDIASDPDVAIEMMDRYVDAVSSTSYQFTMRDDPSLEVGMRVWLKLSSEREYYTWNYVVGSTTCKTSTTIPIQTINYSTLIPVVIQKIKSTFNGGMEATYTVITDNEPRV